MSSPRELVYGEPSRVPLQRQPLHSALNVGITPLSPALPVSLTAGHRLPGDTRHPTPDPAHTCGSAGLSFLLWDGTPLGPSRQWTTNKCLLIECNLGLKKCLKAQNILYARPLWASPGKRTRLWGEPCQKGRRQRRGPRIAGGGELCKLCLGAALALAISQLV